MDLQTLLRKFYACDAASEWAHDRPVSEETWNACPRGDWLLWLLGKLKVDRPRLVRTACECARLALPYVATGETRPLQAIETAEAWARGGEGAPTLDEVRHAADAAYAAADAATAAAYAAYAADAAATAAYAAYSAAADAATAAAYAATAAATAADAAYAAYAADADAAYAARVQVWSQCADVVRRHFAWSEVLELINVAC